MGAADAGGSDAGTSDAGAPGSLGCGTAALHASGGVQVSIDAGAAGDGTRGFTLSRPAGYDPNRSHAVVIGYPGTNWTGDMIRPYLALEAAGGDDVIYVYPDPLWRDFDDWGVLGGWLLGPHAAPANGDQDLVFTGAILDYLEANYCVDTERVFATGHSWGGDMAQVAACFLGDRVRAAAPVATNRPYWFEPSGGGNESCVGDTAVWTLFGADDTHSTSQPYAGAYGDEQPDFWLAGHGCDGAGSATDLGLGETGECVAYEGCDAETRYCLYAAEFGHQRPDYYAAAVMSWFATFD